MADTETRPDDQIAVVNALRHVARDEEAKQFVTETDHVYNALLCAALRFIGGETLSACVDTTQEVNAAGHAVTIDYMGENTRDEQTANTATEEFLRVTEAITEHDLAGSVSLDLSHIGMAVDDELALTNARRIAAAARDADTEVMISMEGTEWTDRILVLHEQLCEEFENVGVTLQAYLHRTDDDLPEVLARPGRTRLVKGAYEEPPEMVRPRGDPVDSAYREYTERLLTNDGSCTLATHDPALLDHAHEYIREHEIDPSQVEFAMLYGVTPERLETMRKRGYDTRIYLPYGTEWYLYLCHRLAEHPPNIYRALADTIGGMKTRT